MGTMEDTNSTKGGKVVTCSRTGMCKLLEERVSGFYFQVGKGLAMLETMDMTTGNLKFRGVVYKRDRRDKGLLLTFCPWCGQRPGDFDVAQDSKGASGT